MNERRASYRRGAVLLLSCIGVLTTACGTATQVSIASLAADSERYAGTEVETQGVVVRFVDPSGPYFVLQDAEEHRVELSPGSSVSGDVGRHIDVTGQFSDSPKVGRVIKVERVSVTHT